MPFYVIGNRLNAAEMVCRQNVGEFSLKSFTHLCVTRCIYAIKKTKS